MNKNTKLHLVNNSDDSGIVTSELYLLCRINDLSNRMEELNQGDYGPFFNEFYDASYRYESIELTLPEFMFKASDIERALSIAYAQLDALRASQNESLNAGPGISKDIEEQLRMEAA